MAIYTIADGQTIQTPQDETGNIFLLTGNSTVVSAGADLIFGSNTPGTTSTIYALGIAADPTGYGNDTVVLGQGNATVLMGGSGKAVVFGGSGHLDLFMGLVPGQLVTGTGDINVIGDQSGAGISYTGGVHDVQSFNGGSFVHENNGHTVTLWAAGTVS